MLGKLQPKGPERTKKHLRITSPICLVALFWLGFGWSDSQIVVFKHALQGYLADKKSAPNRTELILGGWVVLQSETPLLASMTSSALDNQKDAGQLWL